MRLLRCTKRVRLNHYRIGLTANAPISLIIVRIRSEMNSINEPQFKTKKKKFKMRSRDAQNRKALKTL